MASSWNPSTTTKEWVSIAAAIALILVLGAIPKTAGLAKGLAVLFIVLLLLEAQAITRLKNFVSSIGGPTV